MDGNDCLGSARYRGSYCVRADIERIRKYVHKYRSCAEVLDHVYRRNKRKRACDYFITRANTM